MNDLRIVGPIIAALVGLFGWLLKHLSNSDKHPCKRDIVYKDVCKSERKRLDDCIEGAIKRSDERHAELKADMKAEFAEVKDLIRANGRR